MTDHAVSLEQIEAAIDKMNLAHVNTAIGKISAEAKGTPAAVLPQFCPFYKTILRPILVLLSNFVLIPQKVRDAIKTGISFLDVFCP